METRTDRLGALLAGLSHGGLVVDTDGYVVAINDVYSSMSGYSKSEICGKSIFLINAVDARGSIENRMKRIIEDGSLWFETQHKRKDGSVFDIEILAVWFPDEWRIVCFCRDITKNKVCGAHDPEEEKGKEVGVSPPVKQGRAHPARLKILLLEDEQHVGAITSKMISSLGHVFAWVRTGEDAVDRLGETQLDPDMEFDLAILDLVVHGGIGGVEVLKRVRAFNPKIPVILCSGYLEDIGHLNSERYPFQALLQKPFSSKDLEEAIALAMTGSV